MGIKIRISDFSEVIQTSVDSQETQWYSSLNFCPYSIMKGLFQSTKPQIIQDKEEKMLHYKKTGIHDLTLNEQIFLFNIAFSRKAADVSHACAADTEVLVSISHHDFLRNHTGQLISFPSTCTKALETIR